MDKTIRVFISSTWQDLQAEREAVERALQRMRDTSFAGMEYFGSRPETPRDVSLAEVDLSDAYIGIFAQRYGSGITEAEYRQAAQRGLPCLIYFKDDNVPVPPGYVEREPTKVSALDSLKRDLKVHHTVSFFKNPDQLATQVATDLHNLLKTAPTVRQEDRPQLSLKYQVTTGQGQGIVIGDHNTVSQQFDSMANLKFKPAPSQSGEPSSIRIQHLADSIRQDLLLLKDYEDALRYEDDPRRRARYRREIGQVRLSTMEYQREYNELRAGGPGVPSRELEAVHAQLQIMDTKLNALLTGQTVMQTDLINLRQSVLARFDTSEQAIIAAMVDRLDQDQLQLTQAVVDAIESGYVPESDLQETLTSVEQALAEMRQQGATRSDDALSGEVERLSEVIEEPKLDARHRLKLTVPIIPFILSYEGEVELNSGLNLQAAWQRLTASVRTK